MEGIMDTPVGELEVKKVRPNEGEYTEDQVRAAGERFAQALMARGTDALPVQKGPNAWEMQSRDGRKVYKLYVTSKHLGRGKTKKVVLCNCEHAMKGGRGVCYHKYAVAVMAGLLPKRLVGSKQS